MSLRKTAHEAGIDYQMLYRRVKKGMSVDEAIAECQAWQQSDEPTLAEIAREHGINYQTLQSRVRQGWSIEEAIRGERHEAKGEAIAFRPYVAQEAVLRERIEQSGESQQEWVLDAVSAKLEGRVMPSELYKALCSVSEDPWNWIRERLGSDGEDH